ncbi:MAG: hypothetical protein ACOX9E_11135, partial [Lentisphaeria bacterium]
LRRRFALGYHSSRFQRSNAREKMFCGSAVRMTAGTELSIGDRLQDMRLFPGRTADFQPAA